MQKNSQAEETGSVKVTATFPEKGVWLFESKGERTASNVTERQEGVHNVTQEVEFSQQVSAVTAGPGKKLLALPVRDAQLVVADVPDVHQEVEHVPQSASCRSGSDRLRLSKTL